MTVSGWGLLSDGGKAAKKLQEVDLEVGGATVNPPLILFTLPLSDHLDERLQRELPLQEELDIFENDVHFQVG